MLTERSMLTQLSRHARSCDEDAKPDRFTGTDILVTDNGAAHGHRCPTAIRVRRAEVSRRLRRLGATVIDIPGP